MLSSWFPGLLRSFQPWLEPRFPQLWLRLLAQSYALTAGMGRPQLAIAYQPLATKQVKSQKSKVKMLS